MFHWSLRRTKRRRFPGTIFSQTIDLNPGPERYISRGLTFAWTPRAEYFSSQTTVRKSSTPLLVISISIANRRRRSTHLIARLHVPNDRISLARKLEKRR